jgi:hypothetical protein
MSKAKTRAIIAYGLSVLALGLVLVAPGSAWAATKHHHHHAAAQQQAAQPAPPPCGIHFQTACSGM